MGAFDVVGVNFEFGLGVGRRAAVQQHRFDGLHAVGLLGIARHGHFAQIGAGRRACQDGADNLR